ncbi:MAG TPA: CPBP family intramembrane glutamic endopeptidase [Rhizomicrobium sp.]|nr:CPBP family intramembrane glutamic endopeptidase [Rhizomicrobium sp.]
MADDVKRGGGWKRGEFVLWSDVFGTPLLAGIVWLGLLVITVLIAAPLVARSGLAMPELGRRFAVMGRQPWFAQLVTASSDLVLLFFLWRIARRVADGALVARFRAVRASVILLAGLGGVLLAAATMIALVQLYQHGIFKPSNSPQDRMFSPGPAFQLPLVAVTVALIAPFVEEFFFRGVVLSWLARKITLVPAAFVSAAVFALLHFRYLSQPGPQGWMLTGLIGIVGLINATLAIRTRSLWPPFAFHAAYNGTLTGVAMAPFLFAQH